MKTPASHAVTPAESCLSPGTSPAELTFGMSILGALERRGDRIVRTTATPMAGGIFLISERDVTETFNFTPAPRRPQTPAKKGLTR